MVQTGREPDKLPVHLFFIDEGLFLSSRQQEESAAPITPRLATTVVRIYNPLALSRRAQCREEKLCRSEPRFMKELWRCARA